MEETELESANSTDKIQKKKRVLEDKACEVCGDRCTGKHYGVYSCDGCSGFYKRTCRRAEPWLCKGQGQCPVDKSSRNDCKACRLKKCIEIGMNLEGVYRRFRFNEELVKSPPAESLADVTQGDMRVDVTPPLESQAGLGYPGATPQIRIVHTKSVMVKTEEQQHYDKQYEQKQQQQQQPLQQIETPETENNQRRPSSPRYFEDSQGEEFVASRANSMSAAKDYFSSTRSVAFSTPLTSMTASSMPGPVRVTLVSQDNNSNSIHSAVPSQSRHTIATPLSTQRFHPPSTFPSIQQNGHTSPPTPALGFSTSDPVTNDHRGASTALVSFRNAQRHFQPSQMSMSELHQAVEPLSFHSSEPLHDAACRLLTVSLRFGRRLPCFRRLPFRDQVILLEESWREMLLLDSVFWALSLSSGASSDSDPREQEIKTAREALLPLRTLKLDSSEYACLKAVILFRTNIHGLKSKDQVEQLQDEAQLLLADYVWSRLPIQPARFGKILLSVASLRSLAEKPIEHLFFNAGSAKDVFETILSQVISSN